MTVEKEHVEQLKDALMSDLEHGFGIWSKRPSQERYAEYLAVTLAEDFYLALDPDFREDRRKGKRSEILRSEEILMQRMAYERQMAQLVQQGIEVPSLPDDPKLFWAKVAQLPDYVWRFLSQDFRRLHRAQLRKEEFEVPEYEGGLPWT